MDSRLLFPDKYLKSEDFMNREVTLTIRDAPIEMLHKSVEGKVETIVLYFEELHAKALAIGRPQNQKRLAVGKTMQRDLESIFGTPLTEKWRGRVTFYRGPAVGGGKQCIRAKHAPPIAATPTTTETTDTTTPNLPDSNG